MLDKRPHKTVYPTSHIIFVLFAWILCHVTITDVGDAKTRAIERDNGLNKARVWRKLPHNIPFYCKGNFKDADYSPWLIKPQVEILLTLKQVSLCHSYPSR